MQILPRSRRPDPRSAESLIGAWRRFGIFGPVYEIVSVGGDTPPGLLRIRVVETGEELDYPVSAALDDPSQD